MKNIFYSILASLTLALAVSCSDDDNTKDQSILVDIDQTPSDFAPVDLDGDWPMFTGNIAADDNLVNVTFYTDDNAFLEVTSFDGNAKSYDFDVAVPWTLGISYVRVVAESASGDVVEAQRKVNVKGGPEMTVELTDLEVDLSVNPTETISGTITSVSGLAEVVYTLTENGTASTYKTINPSGAAANDFEISEEISFALGMENFNIQATDTKGNVTSHNITINVVESPVFEMFSYTGIELHGTDKRKTGVSIGISLVDGKEHDYDAIIGDTNGKEIDFMISSADSGTPQVRYFSPLTEYGDKFKLGTEGNADLVLNDTQFSKLDRGDSDFFAAATAESIQAMTLTDEGAETTDILRDIGHSSSGVDIINGKVVYFETDWGAQCLVIIRETIDNNGNRKGDSYRLDFKVVYQTN
ncbi:hypothetical protein SAMN04488029_0632 [Reichenbachiella faecimaris]|uniref:Uncharacterized protein n=1 Tax=Reichenbachiella faecimaris TaxID=692418 RepID=A0A1W2G6I4_REIFA|nr:hypothetical protein [Reichenbachiella faecimaris]SMD32289.1 hypothetical protein SAMN04488029_0632 [Reichenbachiella faecimaris]